ncbi:hypothetical protein EKO27_g5160 [Xylaria grammica]|uniref:Uncharacterized protein n=1 Tax=Xylaria grammica TaxID=363999 RepID=A0A439D6D0_9PEZI|nr:hypothetical protein EKO27_g5160 [Xylaria grammica]
MAPIIPWPFSQDPVTIANFDDHHIRMSVASYTDLDAIVDFCSEYSWIVKQETGVLAFDQLVSPELITALMKDRYKYSIKAIMDCCTPGSMTGVVLKVEYQGQIRGVMAVNIVSADFNDPWSQNERQENERPQISWIFPADYTNTLAYTIWETGNQGRPILKQPYLNACIPAFGRTLIKLFTWFNRTTVVNIQSGPYHATFDSYFTGSTFNHTAALLENCPGINQRHYTYSIYTSWAESPQDTPPEYLDDVVRRAFDEP